MGRRGLAEVRGRRRLDLRVGAVAGAVTAMLLAAGAVAAAEIPPPPGPALVPGTPCTTSAKACVEISSHHAWLIRDGVVLNGPVEMMDGDNATPTPRGTFRVEWKAERWTSREYGTPMPYSVFFAPGGIAFHEGQQDTPSAGCVKLVNPDAIAWFQYLQVGDEVQVR